MRFALALLVCSTGLAEAAPKCASEAKERAKALLAFHYDQKPESFAIDDTVKELPPIKALKGNGKFEVLEVWGHIYMAALHLRADQGVLHPDGRGDPGGQRPVLNLR